MLKAHGYLGIILIILVELNFYFKIQPFASWYVPIIWFGYIFLIDSIIFKLKGKSLMISTPKKFIEIVILSVPLWSIFEFYNLIVQNWVYNEYWTILIHLVDFLIIMPAVFETRDLFLTLGWFKKKKTKPLKPSKTYLARVFLFGVFFTVAPWVTPQFFFWGMWVGLFLIFDPINYLLGRDSIISDLGKGKLERFLALGLGGLTCGFLFEFWNFWALPKWFYNIPFFDFWHIFEMPLIGYLGYIPFAWSMFAMYNFVKGLY